MKMKYLIPLFLSRVLMPIYKMGKPIFSMIKYLDKLPLSENFKQLGNCKFKDKIRYSNTLINYHYQKSQAVRKV